MLKKKKTIARIIAYMICACMLGGMVQTIPKVDAIETNIDYSAIKNATYCGSLEEAGIKIRNCIYGAGNCAIVFPYEGSNDVALVKQKIEEVAYNHTGSPWEGDQIICCYPLHINISKIDLGTSCYYLAKAHTANMATFDELKYVRNMIESDFKNDAVYQMDIYNKILYIQNYVGNRAKYSTNSVDGHGENLYGNLVDGGSVCTGFASSCYALALESGIDCRQAAIPSRNHAANILRVGDLYYYANSTQYQYYGDDNPYNKNKLQLEPYSESGGMSMPFYQSGSKDIHDHYNLANEYLIYPPEDYVRVQGITLSKSKILTVIGEKTKITAQVIPQNADNRGYIFRSDNPCIASVNMEGEVFGMEPGETRIWAITADGGKKAYCTVEVAPRMNATSSGLIIYDEQNNEIEDKIYLNVGDSKTFDAIVLPLRAYQDTVWVSNNPSSVSVDENSGVLTVHSDKEAVITAISSDGAAQKRFTVIPEIPTESISFNPSSIKMKNGETVTVKPVITPANASYQDAITWTSSSPSVATVSNGVIKANGSATGTTTITAETHNHLKAELKVTVEAAAAPEGDEYPDADIYVDDMILGGKINVDINVGGAPYKLDYSKDGTTWVSAPNSVGKWTARATYEAYGDYRGGVVTCTFTVKAAPTPTATPKPTETPKPTATPKPTTKPTATPSPSATPVPTDKPGKQNTPTPTATPKPATTPKPSAGDKTPTPTKKPESGRTKTDTSKQGKNKAGIKVKKIKLKVEPSAKIAPRVKVKLTATIKPRKADNKKLKWVSSNPKYAKVNQKGVVTTKKAGAGKTVIITAMAKDGSKIVGKIKIRICKKAVKKITLEAKRRIKAGKKISIKAKVRAGAGANKKLLWKSSNPKYATVSQKGVVRTKKAGKGKKVTITATSMDGTKKTAKIKIKLI